tara:strand:- start:87 stop:266 length:180 start_codon:yes stop_codon:yes gene_type:complete
LEEEEFMAVSEREMAEAYIQNIESRIEELELNAAQLRDHIKECRESLVVDSQVTKKETK